MQNSHYKSHRLGEHQAELVFTTDQKIHDNNISFDIKKLLSSLLFFPSGKPPSFWGIFFLCLVKRDDCFSIPGV